MPIRLARPNDADPIVAILRTSIEQSAITFYEHVPTVGEMRSRIEAALQTHPWLVLELSGLVIGHAAASRYRTSEGSRWGAETSIGMAGEARGRGLGAALYGALLEGTFRRTGYRLGRWHDSLWMQRALDGSDSAPQVLRTPAELGTDPVLARGFEKAAARA